MRNNEGDITRTELYYEVENDASDTNPTLHDLFQLVSVILAACSDITNRHFKRWVKMVVRITPAARIHLWANLLTQPIM